MVPDACPTAEDLGGYASGALSTETARRIDLHITGCALCLSKLDTFVSQPDPIVAALRGPACRTTNSPELAKAVAQVLTVNTHPGVPPSDVTIGNVVGGYQVLEQLGEGGMGSVYRARHPRLEQEVALKVLRPGFDSSQFLVRFEAERQVLALMDHPHIARVSDGGVTEAGRPYFVMELVHGRAITRYCDDEGLDITRRLELFIRVCRGVQHAHQKGMIHRDIKPNNVLVAEYDGGPVPKIIDFGIAKATAGRSAVETEIGTVVGTLEYMSPEQAGLDSRDVDTRSDVYSLGVLLYELLTGDTPLAREQAQALPVLEVLRLVREQEAMAPSLALRGSKSTIRSSGTRTDTVTLARQVRGELDWIVLKALDKDRTRRYETAVAFADDVRRFLNDEVVTASPPSRTYRLRKFARRHRAGLAVAVAFALLLFVGAVTGTVLAVQAREAQTQAEQDRDKAVAAERQAAASAAEARSILAFFQERVLAAGRPEGQEGGLGRDVTIRKAVDAAEPRIAEAFQGQPLVEASVRNTLGMTYIYVGDPQVAIAQLYRARELRHAHAGPDHADTLTSMHNLGVACQQAGQLQRATSVLEQVWKQREALLGAEHEETLRSMNELAVTLLLAGKAERASDLAARAVAAAAATLGRDHADTLLFMSCLASSHQAAGKFKQAVELFEQVVDGLTARFGTEHAHTLAAMTSLGLAYRSDGQLDRAFRMFSKTRDVQSARLGPDHLHTLTSTHNMALVYIDQGQAAQAIPLLDKVLEGRRAKLIPDHPKVISSLDALASAYQLTGHANRAFPLLEQVVELSRNGLGADHPNTLNAMNNLAALNFFTGKVAQAIAIHEATLAGRKAKLGGNHPDTLISMNNLAYCYWKAKKTEQSIQLFQETVAGRTAALGPDHPQTVAVIITLSVVYRDVGRLDQALPLLEEAHADRQKRLGPDHRDTVRLAKELAIIQVELGQERFRQQKFAEAEALLRSALRYYDRSPDTWENFVLRSLIGATLLKQMKYAEAEPLLLQGYEGMMRHESKTPANTGTRRGEGLERLIQLYEAWRKPVDAEKWRKLQIAKPSSSRNP